VAVSVSAFDRYQHDEAWTWELMALTRLRIVAGEVALGEQVLEIARHAIVNRPDEAACRFDILDMRQRLWRERPPRGDWDIKLADGGLVDLEFVLQQEMLLSGDEASIIPTVRDAIDRLAERGALSDEDAGTLTSAFQFMQCLQQIQRLAVGAELTAENFSRGLKKRLAMATSCENFSQLESRYAAVTKAVSSIRCKKIGPLATES
jgi:glutamate-ammonia-ligase adenylyltransferase